MKFFVSWYPGDPYYPAFDPDCSMLVSISSVSRDWTIKKFPKLPRYLMIDSGGYRYALTSKGEFLPKKSLLKQISIIADTGIPTIICPLDYPLLDSTYSSNDKDRNIHQTIAYAYELKNLVTQRNLANYILPMGIIQGDDPGSLRHCAFELKALDFPIYGLGSMARLHSQRLVIERIKSVLPIIGSDKLHLFGISAVNTVIAVREMGIHSVDSSNAAKAAAYNELFYSNPFRRVGILEDKKDIKGKIPLARRISKPLECDCPVCAEDPSLILGVGKRKNIQLRTLHNYYHLKKAFFGN
jgi:7-cyano-7-deazaguanine tRNA-ribosyltransferase